MRDLLVLYEEVETSLDRLTSLIEPVMIVGMAVVIGFIVMAVMQPILEMSSLTNLR